MSTVLPLAVDQGNDVLVRVQCLLDGRPLNLAGYTPQALIKATAATPDSSALATFTTSTGITVVDAPLGELSLLVPHASTGLAGVFWWRLDVTTSGLVYTVLKGPFTVAAV